MEHIQNCGINYGKLASQDGMNSMLTSEYIILESIILTFLVTAVESCMCCSTDVTVNVSIICYALILEW